LLSICRQVCIQVAVDISAKRRKIQTMNSAYRFWERDSKRSKTGKVFYVMFASKPGKWVSSGQDNYKDAVVWAENNKDGSYLSTNVKVPTLKEFADGFFVPGNELWMKRLSRKKKTFASDYFKAHQGRLDNYIMPEYGSRLVTSIKSIEIDNWFLDLRSKQNKIKELSDNAKNKVLMCFRLILEEAKYQGIVEENQAAAVEEINEEHTARQHFDDLEMKKLFPDNKEELLEIWQGLKWTVFFLIMRDTGFRPGEVAGLTRRAYYSEIGGLYTTGSIDTVTGNFKDSIKTSKKGKAYKLGLLEDITLEMLDEYLEESNPCEDELIFPATRGNTDGIKAETSLKHFKSSVNRAEVKLHGRTQYCLRHSFETRKLMDLDLSTVKELMGHSRYRREYDHRSGEERLLKLKGLM